jgi:hypothetical protein
MSMRYQNSNQFVSRPPLCADCAQGMRLARITSRFGELPDLHVFECRACGVSHIEAAHKFLLRNKSRNDLALSSNGQRL